MMPGMDGFELLSRIRERPEHASTPALFLTAKDAPTDRVSGLALGADDYVAKPFLPQELVLRIAAVLRRCYAQESPLLELDASTVNFDTAEVLRTDGETAVLTAKEHEILGVLARNIGRIVTIDALCEACWGTSFQLRELAHGTHPPPAREDRGKPLGAHLARHRQGPGIQAEREAAGVRPVRRSA